MAFHRKEIFKPSYRIAAKFIYLSTPISYTNVMYSSIWAWHLISDVCFWGKIAKQRIIYIFLSLEFLLKITFVNSCEMSDFFYSNGTRAFHCNDQHLVCKEWRFAFKKPRAWLIELLCLYFCFQSFKIITVIQFFTSCAAVFFWLLRALLWSAALSAGTLLCNLT